MNQPIDTKKQDNISLRLLIINFFIHWKLVLVCFFISLILGLGYLIFYPKTYEFMSRILIQPEEASSSPSFSLGGELSGLAQSFGVSGIKSSLNIDDERKYFTTYELLKAVVEDVGISEVYSKPFSFVKLYYQTPFLVSYSTSNAEPLVKSVKFTVRRKHNGKFFITKKVKDGKTEKFRLDSLPASIKTNEGIFDLVRYNEVNEERYTYQVKVSPSGWIAEDLMDAILVDVAAKNSNMIELSIFDHNIERGTKLLNSLMKEYNKHVFGFKHKETIKQIDYFEQRITEVRKELLDQEALIEKFKNTHNMTMLEADVKLAIEGMLELNQKIVEIEAQRHIISLLLSFVSNPDNYYEMIPALYSPEDGDRKSMISMYNELLLERNKMNSISSSDDNPIVRAYDKQLKELRSNIVQMIKNSDQSLALTLKDVKNKESILVGKMKTVPFQEREFVFLKRDQEITQTLYLMLLQKKEMLQMDLDESKDRGRIIDAAYVKQKPIGPRKLYAALGILFFTLFMPILILFLEKETKGLIQELKNKV